MPRLLNRLAVCSLIGCLIGLALPSQRVLAQQVIAITVENPSFEDHRIPGHRPNHRGSVTGWEIETGGVIRLSTEMYGNAVFAGDLSVTHGEAAAFLNRSGTAMQRLNERIEPGMRYTLSVAVGQRTDRGPTEYAVELIAGDVVLATSSEPLPNPGSFVRTTATVEIDDAHPAIGQPISIRFAKKKGSQISFDNVRLTKIIPPTLSQRIQRSVEARLVEWAKKGEFEKSEAHAQRVTDQNRAVARDSIEQIVTNEIAAREIDWAGAMSRYDADREVFTITVKGLAPFDVAVPIAEAKAFDADFRTLRYENTVFVMDGENLRLKAVDVTHAGLGKTYALAGK